MSDRTPDNWAYSDDLWRMSSKVRMQHIDLYFKTLGGHRLPQTVMNRVYTFGIPPEVVDLTLKSIRGLDQWSTRWVETAQQYLGTYRREVSAGNRIEAENARYLAAMSYQAAQILELSDSRTRNICRAWAANLYRLSLPIRNPNARHFTIPWKDQDLPVLFEVPDQGSGPFGLVILLNGVSLSKEETFNWAPRFLEAGYAVLAVDSPGTGEATALGPISPHYTDILEGTFELMQHEEIIDLNRVALVGASLGGNEAIRIARRDEKIMAVVAVTPAVQPSEWMHHASPMLVAEMSGIFSADQQGAVAAAYDVLHAATEGSAPMLIFGAARDMVVPPNESKRLAEAVGNRATLIWYSDLGHCLYVAADQWNWEAATWIAAIGEARADGVTSAAELASIGQQAVEHSTYHPLGQPVADWEDDDVGEYARIITADEAES